MEIAAQYRELRSRGEFVYVPGFKAEIKEMAGYDSFCDFFVSVAEPGKPYLVTVIIL